VVVRGSPEATGRGGQQVNLSFGRAVAPIGAEGWRFSPTSWNQRVSPHFIVRPNSGHYGMSGGSKIDHESAFRRWLVAFSIIFTHFLGTPEDRFAKLRTSRPYC
jgi:hypothetical protein